MFEKVSTIEGLLRNLDSIKNTTLHTMIRNNGGGYYNHQLYFSTLTDEVRSSRGAGGKYPASNLHQYFHSVGTDMMPTVNEFLSKAQNLFGSGWVFAYQVRTTKTGIPKIHIGAFPNQDNPLMNDKDETVKILLGIDCWEHAYYLKYQNKRLDYINGWKTVINWVNVNKRVVLVADQPMKDEL